MLEDREIRETNIDRDVDRDRERESKDSTVMFKRWIKGRETPQKYIFKKLVPRWTNLKAHTI